MLCLKRYDIAILILYSIFAIGFVHSAVIRPKPGVDSTFLIPAVSYAIAFSLAIVAAPPKS